MGREPSWTRIVGQAAILDSADYWKNESIYMVLLGNRFVFSVWMRR